VTAQVRPTQVLKREDMRPRWGFLPLSDREGWRRSSLWAPDGSVVTGTNFKAAITLIPEGQASPPHTWSGEHIICGLTGVVEFVIDGEVFEVRPHDIMFFPENAVYEYRTISDEDASFLSVVGRVDEWPCTGGYDLDGLE
jgi:quercetin dioxygenase-like cupin family protein